MRLIDIEDVALLKTVTDGGLSAKALWRRINSQPTVDAVPVVHGRWASSQAYAEVGECYCSVCKTVYYADDLFTVGETDECGCGQALLPFYCPHCGAKMDGEADG